MAWFSTGGGALRRKASTWAQGQTVPSVRLLAEVKRQGKELPALLGTASDPSSAETIFGNLAALWSDLKHLRRHDEGVPRAAGGGAGGGRTWPG